MLHRIMAAGFQNVVETDHIAFDVGIRVGYGVTHTSLRTKVDYNVRMVLLKDAIDEGFVCKVSFYKGIVLKFLKFSKTSFFDADIIVVVHVVQTNDPSIRFCSQ